MLFPLRQIKARVDWHTRRAVYGAAGLILVAIGAGFLVAAIWMIVAAEFSPLIATLACAALFIGAGIIVFLVRSSRPEPDVPSREKQAHTQAAQQDRPPTAYPALIEALLFGIDTYRQVRKKHSQPHQ